MPEGTVEGTKLEKECQDPDLTWKKSKYDASILWKRSLHTHMWKKWNSCHNTAKLNIYATKYISSKGDPTLKVAFESDAAFFPKQGAHIIEPIFRG